MYAYVFCINRDTVSRLAKAEEECNRLQQELTSARRRGASLDADFHSKERTVNQLRTKLAVVEQVSDYWYNRSTFAQIFYALIYRS